MKVDVFSVNFHRESVTLDEEENELGRSVYGKQSVLVIAPTQDLAVAAAMAGIPDGVLDGAQAVVTGVELPEQAIDGVPPSVHDELEAQLNLTAKDLEDANKHNDELVEQLKAANDELAALKANPPAPGPTPAAPVADPPAPTV